MKHYENILVCVDLSGISEEVILRGNELADYYHAQWVVLYVNHDMPALNEPFGEPPSLMLDIDIREQLEERARQSLKDLAKQTGISDGVPIEVINGYPKTVILEYAKQHNIDLILLGRHKRPAILDLLGSTANTVLHKSQADILLIADNK